MPAFQFVFAMHGGAAPVEHGAFQHPPSTNRPSSHQRARQLITANKRASGDRQTTEGRDDAVFRRRGSVDGNGGASMNGKHAETLALPRLMDDCPTKRSKQHHNLLTKVAQPIALILLSQVLQYRLLRHDLAKFAIPSLDQLANRRFLSFYRLLKCRRV